MHQLHVAVGLSECEVGDGLLVETDVPPHLDPLLSLGLLESLVIVSFQFDERREYVAILVAVLVSVDRKIMFYFVEHFLSMV